MNLIAPLRKTGVCLLLSVSAAMPGAHAQQKLLNIQDLVDSALANYPTIHQKAYATAAARAELESTMADYLPKLVGAEQVSAGSANGIRGSMLPFTATPGVSAVIRENNKFTTASGNITSLYGEYLISDFGLKQTRLQAGEAAVHLREADAAREAYLLKLDICRVYFNILQKRNQLKADLRNKERFESIFQVIYAITASGIQAGVDSILARAEVSKATITFNQTALALQQLYADLAMQTGIDQSRLAIDSFSQVFRDVPVETMTLQPNPEANPLLDVFEKNRQLARSQRDRISKSYRPKLVAGASLLARGSSIDGQDEYGSWLKGLGYQRFNYVAAIGINYDLFNGIRKRRNIAVADFQLQALDQELEFQQLSLQNTAGKAALAAKTAKATLDQLPLQAMAAEKVYQQKLAQYKAGIADLVDLTNASFVMYRSQTDYIQALGDWYRNTLEKAAASGDLDSFIQTIK